MKKFIRAALCGALLFAHTGVTFARSCCSAQQPAQAQCFLLNTGSGNCCGDCRSMFIPRSTGDDLVRQAVYHNYEPYYQQSDSGCFRAVLGAEVRVQKSFETCRIANSLFGTSILRFQGSTIKASDAAVAGSLIADNFGLSPSTDAAILFMPQITNSIVDFQLYFGLDNLYEGLFFQLNLPFTHSKWRLNAHDGLDQTVIQNPNCCRVRKNIVCKNKCGTDSLPVPSQIPFNAGCMGTFTNPIPPAFPATAPSAPTLEAALSGTFLFGDMQTEWTAGIFDFADDASSDVNKLASVNMILGYNALECDDYNLAVYLRAAAPTGTDDSNCCITRKVFAPHVGDNHWKLGAGLSGHYDLCTCNDAYTITLYAEGYAEHFFKRCQARSFDFKDKGCLSRYMLLKQFDDAGVYTGTLINGINFTTRKVETKINVQGEGILEFVYRDNCGFSMGLGWNIYGHSAESACSIGAPCNSDITGNYGFKGCASVQGQCVAVTTGGGTSTISAPLTITATNLNSTQSDATITSCGTVDNAVIAVPTPPGIGTVCFDSCSLNSAILASGSTISAGPTDTTVIITPPGGDAGTLNLALTSQIDGLPAPVIIDPATDLNICSGLLKSQLTNKIFGHFDYEWTDHCLSPKAYIGAEVEIAGKSHCQTMNAWAFYVGGYISY